MTTDFEHLANDEFSRARKALQSARLLAENQLFEDSVSRSYYAVFHAAKAALLKCKIEADTHTAVRSMFGLHIVRPGKVEKRLAKILIAEQEDREIGDYSVTVRITAERANKRLAEAEFFLVAIGDFLSN